MFLWGIQGARPLKTTAGTPSTRLIALRAVAIAAEKMWLVNAYGALDAADISLDE